jgi:hypothetical protein
MKTLSRTLTEDDQVNTDNDITPHRYQRHWGFDGGDQLNSSPTSETLHLL